jgi:peptide/nickel transport system substrate-binding protein
VVLIHRSGALSRLLALLLALALVAAACGDSDDEGAGGDDGTGQDGDGADVPAAPDAGDDGEPVPGGTLVYGVEADTANPWAPYRASYATSGYVVLNTVADPLFTVDRDLEYVPHLLESFEPNEDYSVWTFTVREGITFHDGTPLDAEAVKVNIESCAGSPLAGPAYANIGTVEADGMTVTITTATTPWIALPAYFSGGACSFMFSTQWLTSLDDLPQRTEGNRFHDPEIAALPGGGDPAAPVGTGPFVFQSYTPGNGNSFIATRNEDYWRGPNGITGEDLPYLDGVEIVPAVDIESRSNGLRSGQFDIIHTANSDEISRYLDDDGFETLTSSEYGETSHIMINNAQGVNLMTGAELDPEGTNADNPLTTLACRRALAHALDLERFVETREAGLPEPANGPFGPGSIGYLEDSGYPAFDLEAAEAELETCLAERGTDRIQFTHNTTNDPHNVESNQLAIAMWQEAFGDRVEVSVTPIEQGQYIGLGLTGSFNALSWRNFSGIDPDQQLLWWISATAAPIGELALNFGRFSDEVIDENLITIRTNPDADARREAAEAINRRFGEQVYNWWYYWTVWGVISEPHVNGVVAEEALDGSEQLTLVGARHPMAQIWCEGGSCE